MSKDLKVYAHNIEASASLQIHELMETDIFDGCKVRIMPDAHAGAGCVVGFTAEIKDKIVPNLVGVDIGCGMLASAMGHVPPDYADLDFIIRSCIPYGFNVHGHDTCNISDLGLSCYSNLRNIERLNKSLGTLGGGNHFIEVDIDEGGMYWLVIHSGSRNLGLQVAQIYQQYADETCIADVPKDLKYLEGTTMESYLHDLQVCQRWASMNRSVMAYQILSSLDALSDYAFHTVHNYIGADRIIRKGAIKASKGNRVLVPFNMRDGSIIAIGKGNPDWNESAPHGAGRVMSRSQAKKKLSVDDFEKEMTGVWSSTVCKETIDEAPEAYKPADEILKLIEPTLEVEHYLKPVYNFKAC